jgi:hypothetical protein
MGIRWEVVRIPLDMANSWGGRKLFEHRTHLAAEQARADNPGAVVDWLFMPDDREYRLHIDGRPA